MIERYATTAAAILLGLVLGFAIFEWGKTKDGLRSARDYIRKFPATKSGKYAIGLLCVMAFAALVFVMTGCRMAYGAQYTISADVACGPSFGERYWATGPIGLTEIGDRLYFRSAIDGKAVAPALPCQVLYR